MLEQQATVERVSSHGIWVNAKQQSACQHCSSQTVCGTSTLGKWLGRRQRALFIHSDTDFTPGEQVMIGIPESALLLGSFFMYLWPLICMFIALITVKSLMAPSDTILLLVAIVTLAAAFRMFRWWMTGSGRQFSSQLRVLGKIECDKQGKVSPLQYQIRPREN